MALDINSLYFLGISMGAMYLLVILVGLVMYNAVKAGEKFINYLHLFLGLIFATSVTVVVPTVIYFLYLGNQLTAANILFTIVLGIVGYAVSGYFLLTMSLSTTGVNVNTSSAPTTTSQTASGTSVTTTAK